MELDEITAIYDPSKPLQHHHNFFNTMIGRKDKIFSNMFGNEHPITFNLSGPIQFLDSKHTHGIQVADAIAAAAVHTFSGADDDHANKWRLMLPNFSHYGSVVPDLEDVDLADQKAQRNAVVLLECGFQLHQK